MLREFFSVFRSDDPLGEMGAHFMRMLTLTSDMAVAAGEIYFAGSASPEARKRIYDQDIEVNKLERQIRKLIVVHLSVRKRPVDIPYCLLLLNLVKDVERLGDYAKNLSELIDLRNEPPPEDEQVAELRVIRTHVEATFRAAPEIVSKGVRERAVALIPEGRAYNKRCDELMKRVAGSGYDGRTAVSVALAARYYKRFGGHLLNVLSSVVMPLHKLDFFDEDALPDE